MFKRYLLASFVGGLIGACCVLVVVYVTNTNALAIDEAGVDSTVTALHSRINDFYIFAGIVITLLLAINVGVFVRADEEVDRQIEKSFGPHKKRLNELSKKYKTELKVQNRKEKLLAIKKQRHETNDEEFDSELRNS